MDLFNEDAFWSESDLNRTVILKEEKVQTKDFNVIFIFEMRIWG